MAIGGNDGDCTGTTNDSNNDNDSHDSPHYRVAIIGAGFAGLTLANYLEQHNNTSNKSIVTTVSSDDAGSKDDTTTTNHKHRSYYSYCVFESKSKPLPIIGTIKLPSGPSVFEELGLQTEWEQRIISQEQQQQQEDSSRPPPPPPPSLHSRNTTITSNKMNKYDDVDVPREPVLETLRGQIHQNLQFSCHVVDVITSHQHQRQQQQQQPKNESSSDDADTKNQNHIHHHNANYDSDMVIVDHELDQNDDRQQQRQPQNQQEKYYVRTVRRKYIQYRPAINNVSGYEAVVDESDDESDEIRDESGGEVSNDRNGSNDSSSVLHGPFDIVVDAQGFVLSQNQQPQYQPQYYTTTTTTKTKTKTNENDEHYFEKQQQRRLLVRRHNQSVHYCCDHHKNYYRIGDRRWQDDVPFYDFGRRRRREGADIAIRDGLELGKLIVLNNDNNSTKMQTHNTDTHIHPSSTLLLRRFQAPTSTEVFQQKQRQRFFRNAIIFPIILMITYRFVQSFEKIWLA